jgi:hypothetical protein
MSAPEFYQQSAQTIADVQDKLNGVSEQLEKAYERWEVLEEKQTGN